VGAAHTRKPFEKGLTENFTRESYRFPVYYILFYLTQSEITSFFKKFFTKKETPL